MHLEPELRADCSNAAHYRALNWQKARPTQLRTFRTMPHPPQMKTEEGSGVKLWHYRGATAEIKERGLQFITVISGLYSPTWICYRGCDLDFIPSYLVTLSNIAEVKTLYPTERRPEHTWLWGCLSAVILQDMGCENENLSPCCCDPSHQKTPSPVLRPLLELSQRCCPAHWRGCALPHKSRRKQGSP